MNIQPLKTILYNMICHIQSSMRSWSSAKTFKLEHISVKESTKIKSDDEKITLWTKFVL